MANPRLTSRRRPCPPVLPVPTPPLPAALKFPLAAAAGGSARHGADRAHLTAVAQALFVTVLWSSSWVLIAIGLRDLPALTFAGLRYGLAALLLTAVWAASSHHRAELAASSWRVRWELLVLGVVFYAIAQGAQFAAIALLPTVTVSLLLSFTPALVALLGLPLLGERLTRTQWLGVAVFLLGAAAYLRPHEQALPAAAGFAVAGLCLLANAAAGLLGRRVNRDSTLTPLTVTTVSMGIGAALLLGTGLAVEGMPSVTPQGWLIIGWLAVVNTAGAFVLWNFTLRRLTATESSVVNNSMLVQIAILSVLFLDARLGPLDVLGLPLAVVGIAVVQLTGHRRTSDDRARH